MASRSVSVTGEDHLRADLRGMVLSSRNLHTPLEREAAHAAAAITGVARRSGTLAKAVKDRKNRVVDANGFDIHAGTFYGHMVFGGTSHSRPQPPTIPAKSIARSAARSVGAYIVRHRHGVGV